MRRLRLVAFLVSVGALVGSIVFRRRQARMRERVDLYAEDGSMASLADGTPEAARLLPLARTLLTPAGGA
jgi:hypothetical protein